MSEIWKIMKEIEIKNKEWNKNWRIRKEQIKMSEIWKIMKEIEIKNKEWNKNWRISKEQIKMSDCKS